MGKRDLINDPVAIKRRRDSALKIVREQMIDRYVARSNGVRPQAWSHWRKSDKDYYDLDPPLWDGFDETLMIGFEGDSWVAKTTPRQKKIIG
jgi:hypothetical protein